MPTDRAQVGQVMAEYPLDPQLAKMVVASPEFRFASHAAAHGAAAGRARGHAPLEKHLCMAVTSASGGREAEPACKAGWVADALYDVDPKTLNYEVPCAVLK